MQRAEEVKKRARTKLSEEVPPAVVDRGEQKSLVWSGGSTDGASDLCHQERPVFSVVSARSAG
jgi:hypothetical protein